MHNILQKSFELDLYYVKPNRKDSGIEFTSNLLFSLPLVWLQYMMHMKQLEQFKPRFNPSPKREDSGIEFTSSILFWVKVMKSNRNKAQET